MWGRLELRSDNHYVPLIDCSERRRNTSFIKWAGVIMGTLTHQELAVNLPFICRWFHLLYAWVTMGLVVKAIQLRRMSPWPVDILGNMTQPCRLMPAWKIWEPHNTIKVNEFATAKSASAKNLRHRLMCWTGRPAWSHQERPCSANVCWASPELAFILECEPGLHAHATDDNYKT